MKKMFFATMAVAVLSWTGAVSAQEQSHHPLRDAASGKMTAPTITTVGPSGKSVTKRLPFFSSGALASMHDALRGPQDNKEADIMRALGGFAANLSLSDETLGCGSRNSASINVRINQDCTFRRQAEEKIVYNPANPRNLLAGMNDSRVGFNQNSIGFSFDNGEHWGDLLPPFRQKLNDPKSDLPTANNSNRNTIFGDPGTGHTYDFCSDPAPAFDSQGRGFYTCVAVDINDTASMIFAAQSPVGAQGAFFLNISGRNFVVAEDNNPSIQYDKPFSTADTFATSPNRDNVYVTWTLFRFDCPAGFCSSTIFGSMSTDHGLTWSTPEEISGSSPTLCFFGNFFDQRRSPNSCDFDQGSDPAAQPNGDLVVIFNNGNTAANNPNAQQLSVTCHPAGSSTAGTAHLNCGSPSKVGDDILVGEPTCDFGRGPEQCVPGPSIRTNDFPRIAVSPINGHLYAAWQDYRNGELDIQLTTSTNGGATWSQGVTANPDSGLDHYFAAVAVAPENGDGDHVGVSYFRSGRVPNENTQTAPFAIGQPGVGQEDSDYVLAGGKTLHAPFRFTVVSPVFPPPDGIQAGFNGDYSGLTINMERQAHPIWSDTRNADPFSPLNGVKRDEDVFTDSVRTPFGMAKPSIGQLGQGDGGGGQDW
jgi:hypothetical protein